MISAFFFRPSCLCSGRNFAGCLLNVGPVVRLMTARTTRDWPSIKESLHNSSTSGCHTLLHRVQEVFLFSAHEATNTAAQGETFRRTLPESIWPQSLCSGGFRGLFWLPTCLSSNSGGSNGPFLLLLQLMQLSVPTASKSTNCLRQPMALFSHWEYSFVLTSYFIRAAVYCNKVTTHT